MKIFLFCVYTIFAISALGGVSGAGGGSTINNRVTVQVCGQGESGEECRIITYDTRPTSPSLPTMAKCYVGETEGPCPTVYGVPQWLQKLNTIFEKPTMQRLQKP